jgi:hypothetical protein
LIPFFIEYLSFSGELPLQGLGYLRVKKVSAKLDITTRLLTPPSQEYIFESSDIVDVEPFYSWLRLRRSTTSHNDESAYLQFVGDLNKLSGTDLIEWKGIGIWRKEDNQKVVFEPGKIKNQLKALVAEKVIRSEAVHSIQVGELESDSVEMSKRLSQKAKRAIPLDWFGVFLLITVLALLSWVFLTGRVQPGSISNPGKIFPQEGSHLQYRSL